MIIFIKITPKITPNFWFMQVYVMTFKFFSDLLNARYTGTFGSLCYFVAFKLNSRQLHSTDDKKKEKVAPKGCNFSSFCVGGSAWCLFHK